MRVDSRGHALREVRRRGLANRRRHLPVRRPVLPHSSLLRTGGGEPAAARRDARARLPTTGEPNMAEPDPSQPAAVILVGDYSGLGIHTMLNAVRFAPDHFKSFVFVSVGVIDSGNFKGGGAVEALREHCEESLAPVRRSRPAAGNALHVVPLGRHRCRRRAGAQLPGDRPHSFPRPRFLPANWCFRRTPGCTGCCTTRRPIRCSAVCNGRACRW